MGELRFNYSFGATLSIPLYMKGNRKHQISIARSDANKALQSIDLIKRNIIRGVSDNYYSLVSAAARILQLEFQVQLAERTYSQAEVNYKAGSITNLELLTTITNKSNSKLMLLQEKINFEITYYQLLQNIGVNISPLEQEP